MTATASGSSSPGSSRTTKVDISRFKGLGEMPPADLKRTTMDPAHRTLLKVVAAARGPGRDGNQGAGRKT